MNAQLINAADYGVPQRRKRVLIVGILQGEEFVFPRVTHGDVASGLKPYVSVKDAIGELPRATESENAR